MRNQGGNEAENLTICIGLSIVLLGFFYLMRVTIIPSSLVIGVSFAGFCLTSVDFFDEMHYYEKKKNLKSSIINGLLYLFAAMGIIVMPNLKMDIMANKDALDTISTGVSVATLGYVFMITGFRNKRISQEQQIQQKRYVQRVEELERQIQLLKENENKKVGA
ncbi:coiled-coil domain-containing protein 30 [Bacillus mycoides]|uniref:coiled-coil domain-containing protein 30 n=1 Tax=Bacillus mycoides TaxID=1405 RepID=UPI001F08B0E6|nr:coiled-coil domain-containing protein 30 [Bacillus mycoides]